MTKDPLPYDEASTWVLIRERIGWLLRERYRIPKELPPNLLTVVGGVRRIRKLSAVTQAPADPLSAIPDSGECSDFLVRTGPIKALDY
jgi:hypothetical protein